MQSTYLTPSIISNRQILIVGRENALNKFHTFSVLLTVFLVYHDLKTKNKIICIDAPMCAFTHINLPESEIYVWIIQNVHEKSRFFHISITRTTRHSAVSPLTETIKFLERSLASMVYKILLQHDWLFVFCLFFVCFFCLFFFLPFFASCFEINVFFTLLI